MPYVKYKICGDSKCPACGNDEYLKLPKTAMKTIMGSYLDPDPEILVQIFPAICSACGCMFVMKNDLDKILSTEDLIEREDKKENPSQDSVDEF